MPGLGSLILGGVWSRGCLLWGLPALGGGVLVRGVPGGDLPTATAAGSTHPPGMLSCLIYFRLFSTSTKMCTLKNK